MELSLTAGYRRWNLIRGTFTTFFHLRCLSKKWTLSARKWVLPKNCSVGSQLPMPSAISPLSIANSWSWSFSACPALCNPSSNSFRTASWSTYVYEQAKNADHVFEISTLVFLWFSPKFYPFYRTRFWFWFYFWPFRLSCSSWWESLLRRGRWLRHRLCAWCCVRLFVRGRNCLSIFWRFSCRAVCGSWRTVLPASMIWISAPLFTASSVTPSRCHQCPDATWKKESTGWR